MAREKKSKAGKALKFTKAQKKSGSGTRIRKVKASGDLRGFRGVFELQDHLTNTDGSAVVSFLVTQPASKIVAVNVAVTNQLIKDGRWPPMDLTKVMSAIPYRYNDRSMRNFLDGVAGTLAAGLPPIEFPWNGAFVTKALPLTVAVLMAEIEMASK